MCYIFCASFNTACIYLSGVSLVMLGSFSSRWSSYRPCKLMYVLVLKYADWWNMYIIIFKLYFCISLQTSVDITSRFSLGLRYRVIFFSKRLNLFALVKIDTVVSLSDDIFSWLLYACRVNFFASYFKYVMLCVDLC